MLPSCPSWEKQFLVPQEVGLPLEWKHLCGLNTLPLWNVKVPQVWALGGRWISHLQAPAVLGEVGQGKTKSWGNF